MSESDIMWLQINTCNLTLQRLFCREEGVLLDSLFHYGYFEFLFRMAYIEGLNATGH